MDLRILSLVVLVLTFVNAKKNRKGFEGALYNKNSTKSETSEGKSSIGKANVESITSNKAVYPVDTNSNPESTPGKNETQKRTGDNSEFIIMPVFGRPVFLGSLYDATTDIVFNDMSLWKPETIKDATRRSDNPRSFSDYSSAETSYDRVAKMDISASIKLSFLGGLIKVSGSAQYLRDSVESNNVVSGTMIYTATTFHETLEHSIKADYNQVCVDKKYKVTHVVSNVKYGMKAYFDFRREVKSSETKEQIKGQLKASMDSIPGFKVSGQVDASLEGSVKSFRNTVNVKYFGDFVLDKSPTTFAETLEVYKALPSLLVDQTNKAPKQEMTLTPLKYYCAKVNQVLHSINTGLINNVLKVLGAIERIKLRTNGLKRSEPYQRFPSIRFHLDKFMNKLDDHASIINRKLKRVLPKIKEGKKDSDSLSELVIDHNNSPFEEKIAEAFLDTREREINVIQIIIDISKDKDVDKDTAIQMVDYVDANDALYILSRKYVFTFEINILPDAGDTEKFLETKVVNKNRWFNEDASTGRISREFRKFKEFALRNADTEKSEYGFLVELKKGPDTITADTIVTLNIQKDGEKYAETFIYPKMPVIKGESRTHNSFKVNVETTTNAFVVSYVIAYWQLGMNKEEEKVVKNFDINKVKDDQELEINNLLPNHVYKYEIWHLTEVGKSAVLTPESFIITRPTSPPENVQLDERQLSTKGAHLIWDEPAVVGDGVEVTEYMVQLKQGGTVVVSNTVGVTRTFEFTELDPATTYMFSVKAKAGKKATERKRTEIIKEDDTSLWKSFDFTTLPEAPEAPILDSVEFHSAVVSWKQATKIAAGSSLIGYGLKVMLQSTSSLNTIDVIYVRRFSQSPAELEDLGQGKSYVVQIKIITTLGNSPYSADLKFNTKTKETAYDKIRDEISETSNKMIQELNTKSTTLATQILDAQARVNTKVKGLKDNIGELNAAVMEFHTTGEGAIGAKKYPLYFPAYNARYLGLGMGIKADGTRSVGIDISRDGNLTACVASCSTKQKSNPSINGLRFTSNQCTCETDFVVHQAVSAYNSYHYKLL